MSTKIEVLVSPAGETRIRTTGFQGNACREATKTLEAALGQKVTESLTTEYYQPTRQEANVTEHHDTQH